MAASRNRVSAIRLTPETIFTETRFLKLSGMFLAIAIVFGQQLSRL